MAQHDVTARSTFVSLKSPGAVTRQMARRSYRVMSASGVQNHPLVGTQRDNGVTKMARRIHYYHMTPRGYSRTQAIQVEQWHSGHKPLSSNPSEIFFLTQLQYKKISQVLISPGGHLIYDFYFHFRITRINLE